MKESRNVTGMTKPPALTPEQIKFHEACQCLYLDVPEEVAREVMALGKAAITAAVQAQREKDARLAWEIPKRLDYTADRLFYGREIAADIADAIEKQE